MFVYRETLTFSMMDDKNGMRITPNLSTLGLRGFEWT